MQAGNRRADARRLLDAGGRDPAFENALARLTANEPIRGGVSTPQEGLGELFTRMAADLSREKPLPIALVMARYATFLQPGDADAWIVTSDVLSRNEQYDAALTALDRIRVQER